MRKNRPKTSEQNAVLTSNNKRINSFFKSNIYLLAFSMVALNLLTYCSNSDFHDESIKILENHGDLLKRNLGKVHFLTASGQHIVGQKRAIGYNDPRFKRYIVNAILENQIQGLGALSKGFKVKILKDTDISNKNEKWKFFDDVFLSAFPSVNKLYREGVFRAIIEGRYPEYILVEEAKLDGYQDMPQEDNPEIRHLKGNIRAKLYVKSYIKELKVWDTREIDISVIFKATINVAEYADVGNPFGLEFTEIQIPTILKPTATEVARLRGKR